MKLCFEPVDERGIDWSDDWYLTGILYLKQYQIITP